MTQPQQTSPLTKNVTPVSRLELPGAGQVSVVGKYAYIGHIRNQRNLGTSILDVSDPRQPRIVSQIFLDDPNSHSHKARVVGDIMIVNSERQLSAIGRRAEDLPKLRAELREVLGREPNHAELAEKLGVKESDIPAAEALEKQPYQNCGFKIYDISNREKPKLITFHRTHGMGVHRFDMDANYAYISTEMPGYLGNILVNYDISNPAKPAEVSRWWLPGQHIDGGEKPTWHGRRNRLHHAMRVGDRMYAGCWMGGVRVIDVSDIRKPRTIGEYDYHPPFADPSHTFMPMPFKLRGKDVAIAIDEEDFVHDTEELDRRRGRPHACLWVLDISDVNNIQALSIYEASELDSPWSRTTPGRFGAHQFQEQLKDTMVYCAWFAGGLRIVDIADPSAPREVGYYVPQPAQGKATPQTNDVALDERGLVYIVDRYAGLDILEFNRPN